MSRARARAYASEVIRRAHTKSTWGPQLLYEPAQRAFGLDPAKFKAGLCSRRSGKTTADAWLALDTAQRHPRVGVPYVTLTRTSQAARAMWSELDRLNDEHRLGAHMDRVRLVMTLPNKAYIFIAGADDARTIERLRGDKAPGIIVDEAQGFGDRLEGLVLGTLLPSLIDLDGWLVMTGTPGAVCAGFFWKVTTGKVPGWSVHRWNCLANPHIQKGDPNGPPVVLVDGINPKAEAWLAELRQTMGWSVDHPDYVREWLGEWVDDPNALVYRMPDSGRLHEMPVASDWHYVLGLDIGYTDSCAFTVLAWSEQLHMTVIVSSWRKPEMLPTDVVAVVKELDAQYGLDRIVIDPGGGGKGYGEEMRQRHGLPVIVAQKRKKVGYISHMNGEMQAGMLKVLMPTSRQLVEEEWDLLPWNADRSDVDDRVVPDHCADSALYGWRECKAWLPRGEEAPPPTGPDPHLGPRPAPQQPDEMKAMWARKVEEHRRQEEDPWALNEPPVDIWMPGDFPA